MEKIAIFPSFKATLNANNVFKKNLKSNMLVMHACVCQLLICLLLSNSCQ